MHLLSVNKKTTPLPPSPSLFHLYYLLLGTFGLKTVSPCSVRKKKVETVRSSIEKQRKRWACLIDAIGQLADLTGRIALIPLTHISHQLTTVEYFHVKMKQQNKTGVSAIHTHSEAEDRKK